MIFLQFHVSAHAEESKIALLSWGCMEEGSQIVVTGEIRNLSREALTPVVIVVYRSITGSMVTHSREVPVFNPLQGGQASPIELRIPNRRDIASCELTLQDPTSGKIYTAVKQDLPFELRDGLGDVRKGKSIFNSKGVCNACHGYRGQIDQIPDITASQVAKLNPKPHDLTPPKT